MTKAVPSPNAGALTTDAQAAMDEARRMRRRRLRRGSLAGAALLVVAAAVVATWRLDAGGRKPTAPKPASLAELHAFVSAAQAGTTGDFVAMYSVTTVNGTGLHRSSIYTAQSGQSWVYRSPDIWASGKRSLSAVYQDPLSVAGASVQPNLPPGFYICPRSASGGGCGSEGQIGMGTINLLLGAYPPKQLFFELSNAVATYAVAAGSGFSQAPAYLVTERVGGRNERCVVFRDGGRTLATFCLGPHDLVSYMEAPSAATNGTFIAARLVSYSSTVPRSALELPAAPTPFGP